MTLYADTPVAVPDTIASFHAAEFDDFSRPGTWLEAEERVAVLRRARESAARAGRFDGAVDGVGSDPASLLPDALLQLIDTLATTPQAITRADYDAALASGMSDAEYAEVVGLVARLTNLDYFARGIGATPAALRAPRAGEPTYARPVQATDEGAWLATLPCDERGGAAGRDLYGGAMQPFIYRALSLVPATAARIIEGGNVHYLGLEHFFDFGYSLFRALTRPQVEIVAARASALNACFY